MGMPREWHAGTFGIAVLPAPPIPHGGAGGNLPGSCAGFPPKQAIEQNVNHIEQALFEPWDFNRTRHAI